MSVVALAIGSALLFGLALTLTQMGLRDLSPLHGACISISTAAVIFVLLSPATVDFASWNGRSAGLFAAIGCLFPATVTFLTFRANLKVGPNLTGALGNLAPLFAVGLAIGILGETPGPQKIAAIAVILVGIAVLFLAPTSARRGRTAWALWLPIAAAVIRGAVQPGIKLAMVDWPNPFAAATIGYIVSAAVVLAVSAIRQRGRPVPFTRRGWLWFSCVGICNGLAVFSMYQALALGSVTVVSPLVACYPVATVVFGRIIFGRGSLDRATVAGVGLTVTGVVLLLVV